MFSDRINRIDLIFAFLLGRQKYLDYPVILSNTPPDTIPADGFILVVWDHWRNVVSAPKDKQDCLIYFFRGPKIFNTKRIGSADRQGGRPKMAA